MPRFVKQIFWEGMFMVIVVRLTTPFPIIRAVSQGHERKNSIRVLITFAGKGMNAPAIFINS